MTATAQPADIRLPPLFALERVEGDPFAAACARAEAAGAGTFLLAERSHLLAWAVVLEPATPLAAARRVFPLGMAAAADALAAHCLPERAVAIGWPDVLVYDASRIGGGRLAWPEDTAETDVPDWLVLGIELLADRDDLAEPGRFPASTSLKEELFESHGDLVESFARNLMYRLDLWETKGYDAAASDYLGRLDGPPGEGRRIGPAGDLLVREASGRVRSFGLAGALAAASWRDPARGGPRL